MYRIFRPILFLFSPETIHVLAVKVFSSVSRNSVLKALIGLIYKRRTPSLPTELFGLTFPNPVGLAGGFDKNAVCYNALFEFGFGFIEVGSLTPQAQPGNPRPRIFRFPADKAIINRMGINNAGVRKAIENLKAYRPGGILCGNISKNSNSEGDQITRDYLTSFTMLYDFVDMFTLNVSCPNVEGLSNLQDISFLSEIVDALIEARLSMELYKPLLVKISPDIPISQLDEIVNYCRLAGVDGIIIGNTTRSRDGMKSDTSSVGQGGLSGAPLTEKTISLIKHVSELTSGRFPIVASGGIMTPSDAKHAMNAGASLVEIYTGFIYNGPGIVKSIVEELKK